ncbi:MAG: GAF domain-containing protein, partial [Chloroflexota bacterium]|nr:GAF domain-containing protein [Chloroflexota bacterium]
VAMKSGLLEDHAARMRESEVRVQSAPEMGYRDIAVPEMIFHSLCYPRISVLYEDPSRRQEAISILSKAFETSLARVLAFFAETREKMFEAQRVDLQLERERLQHRTLQLEISSEVGRRITSALELDELLSQIVELVKETFGYYHVHIYLVDYEANVLVMREGTGEPGRVMKERNHRVEMGRGLVGRAATTGKSVLVPDVGQEPAWLPNPLLPETKSELSAPLILGDRVIGVLDVQNNEVGGLTEDDLILLEGLGAQIAVAIENARLFREEQRRYQMASTLREVTRILSSSLDLQDVPDMILEQLGSVVDYDSAAIFLLSDGFLKAVAGRGFPDMDQIIGTALSTEENALFRQICQEKRPLVLADAQKDERFLGAGGTGYVRGWIGAPLIVKGEIIGSLTVDSRQPGVYDEETAQTVFMFASQAALALENARLFEETRRRERQTRSLYEAGQLASRLEGGLEVGLQAFFERLTEVGSFDRWWVPLLSEGGLSMQGLTGRWEAVQDEQMKRHVVLADEPRNPAVIAIQQQEMVIINDPEHDERLADLPENIRRAAGKYITVPVISVYGERVIGAVSFGRPADGPDISADDVDLARTLAGQVALVIENARLFEQTQTRVEQTQLLLRVSEATASTLDRMEIMRRISREVAQVLGADMTGAYLLDETGEKLQVVAGYHVPPERLKMYQDYEVPIKGHPFVEEAWAGQMTIFTDNAVEDPRFDQRTLQMFPARSVLATPMVIQGRGIGVIFTLWWEEVHQFTEDERDLVEGIVRQAAIAIENARLFAQTQDQVRRLQASIETQERLTQTVRELSSPVVQVWEGVLALPIVGGIDSTRAKQITEELLTGIVKYQAEMVIIDITGVPVVDTHVAHYILQTIRAASLLGARCVLVGIGAEVAQAMIGLGVDLSEVNTLSNLQAGIRYALETMGLEVAPLPPDEWIEGEDVE